MKTDQLIAAMVADRTVRPALSRRLGLSIALGGLLSFGLFWLILGPRHDLGPALATWRFDLKVALMVLAVVLAFGLCRTLARPVSPAHPGRPLLLLLAAIAAAVGAELCLVPQQQWLTRLIGSNSLICLAAIPTFSAAPLLAIFVALRSGAPASPALAGAAAGLLAAACGATLYAFHCFDDSPLFVATWYSAATAIVIAIGTAAGRRYLRW
jgi:hypothetical protein